MQVKKIFISHSSKTKKNLAFLKQICLALGQGEDGAGYDVLVDKGGKIPLGEEWFRYLAEWMAECDAAVILFSKAALKKSQWVRAEAAILSWRKRIQQDFMLVGVLLDGLKIEEIDDDHFYGVIRISDFQMIRDRDGLAEILPAIRQELGRPDSHCLSAPFEELARQIRDILNTLECEDALEHAWEELEYEHKPKWRPGMDFGDALARMLLRDRKHAFVHLRALIEKLAHVLPAPKAETLLELLRGLWVNPEAAATLAWARANHMPVSLNGFEVEDFTGPSYIRWAWPFPKDYSLVSVGEDRSLDQIRDVLLATVAKSISNPRRAQRRLKQFSAPLILVFPYPEHDEPTLHDAHFPDEALLRDIGKAYPNVTVVLATGQHIPQELDSYVMALEPLLEKGEEDKQCGYYDDVRGYIYRQLAGQRA